MPDAPTRTVDQDKEDAEPVTDVDVAPRPWWNSLARIAALFVVLCALAAPGIAYKIHENRALSPIDELNYS